MEKLENSNDTVLLTIKLNREQRNKFVGLLRTKGSTAKDFLMKYIDEFLEENRA